MYACPACGARDATSQTLCKCGADLSLLRALAAVTDAWFNRALLALANGNAGEALEWLSACCAAQPTDAAARRAQSRVWAQLGHLDEARRALDRARQIDGASPDLAAIEQALDDATVRTKVPSAGRAVAAKTRPARIPTRGQRSKRQRKTP